MLGNFRVYFATTGFINLATCFFWFDSVSLSFLILTSENDGGSSGNYFIVYGGISFLAVFWSGTDEWLESEDALLGAEIATFIVRPLFNRKLFFF